MEQQNYRTRMVIKLFIEKFLALLNKSSMPVNDSQPVTAQNGGSDNFMTAPAAQRMDDQVSV